MPSPCCSCKKKETCTKPCAKKKKYNEAQRKLMSKHRNAEPARSIRGGSEGLEIISRQAGCTNRTKTIITPDSKAFLQKPTEDGSNTQIMSFLMELAVLMPINLNDADALQTRLGEYIQICAKCDAKPSVASLALALGCDRVRLWEYKHGKTKGGKPLPVESCELIRRAYIMLNASLEQSMMESKIQQVSGIFLLKSNFGYRDDQEMIADADKQDNADRARKAAEYKEMLENSK